MTYAVAALLIIAAAQAPGQPRRDVWTPLEYFVGSWTGDETATFGKGKGERTYRFILQGRYLISQNTSRFPPPGTRAAEVHEDWTIFSYDSARRTFIVRQLNSEGFVNTLAMDAPSVVPRTMRFAGESSENAPPGTAVVLEYEIVSDEEFVERFEVRFPGRPDPMVIRNRWRRASVAPGSASKRSGRTRSVSTC